MNKFDKIERKNLDGNILQYFSRRKSVVYLHLCVFDFDNESFSDEIL